MSPLAANSAMKLVLRNIWQIASCKIFSLRLIVNCLTMKLVAIFYLEACRIHHLEIIQATGHLDLFAPGRVSVGSMSGEGDVEIRLLPRTSTVYDSSSSYYEPIYTSSGIAISLLNSP